jgi:fermentation-respiration switch protein FrsA (DUF1100 family)
MATRDGSSGGIASRPRRRWRRWLAVAAGILAVLLVLGYAGVSYAVYDGLSSAKGGCWDSARANTPDSFSVDAKWGSGLADAYRMPKPQDVVFHSRDTAAADVNLAGWWIPADGAAGADAPAVVVVHGILSCRREASVLLAAGMLHKNGFSVFIMDMRNHGDSGFSADHRIAGGSVEYLDVLGGWDWVRAQGVPADRIGIIGFSFGSSVVLTAGGEEPAVRAVWADSSFTTTERGMGLFLKDQTGLPDVFIPGTVLWGRVNGIDFLRFDPVTEVAKYQGRYLAFAHGAEDKVLPATMATMNHDAAAAAGAHVADVFIVPNAGHTEADYADPAGYEARLAAFFGQALAPGGG